MRSEYLKSSALSSRVIVFPLCDERGQVTDILCGTTSARSLECHPESVFLAWLLDLPVGVEAAAAAASLLVATGCRVSPPTTSDGNRYRLYQLMCDAADAV